MVRGKERVLGDWSQVCFPFHLHLVQLAIPIHSLPPWMVSQGASPPFGGVGEGLRTSMGDDLDT